MMKNNQKLYTIVFVGMTAAMIYAVSMLVRIPIPTPVGETQLKLANMLCLLAGMLFGGVYGGLAAGIGSMLFDLSNPAYTRYAPFTLVFFFVMGCVCGLIANAHGAKAQSTKLNLLGAISGVGAYWILNTSRNVIELMLGENAMGLQLALAAVSTKMITSAINAVIAVAGALLLIVPLQKALRSAGVLDKMGR